MIFDCNKDFSPLIGCPIIGGGGLYMGASLADAFRDYPAVAASLAQSDREYREEMLQMRRLATIVADRLGK